MALVARRTVMKMYLGAGMVAGLAGLAYLAEERVALGPTDGKGFRPIRWPFPADAWPPGRAWTGHDLDFYVRLKFDVCSDCETGVISDEAVDRVVDIDRLDPRFAPVGPGSRIRITDLFGRSRLYRHQMHNGAPRLAEGIVVAYRCDLAGRHRRRQHGRSRQAQDGASVPGVEHRADMGEQAARGAVARAPSSPASLGRCRRLPPTEGS